ncbi:hypothetical protein E2C01_004280 [Portunus trituberculatus]|uniref:Uncharacterized protein n=1 Tax=Portunus trituberculatus TaxID=210409 RepID=A0A5B7CQ72_PORTR|nr:hypothetical protein [Portunus trituberculatus]
MCHAREKSRAFVRFNGRLLPMSKQQPGEPRPGTTGLINTRLGYKNDGLPRIRLQFPVCTVSFHWTAR